LRADANEIEETCTKLNRSGADFIWVGLSTPKQEHWMDLFRPMLDAPVIAGVGAAFDIHAGRVTQGATVDATIGPRMGLPARRRASSSMAKVLIVHSRLHVADPLEKTAVARRVRHAGIAEILKLGHPSQGSENHRADEYPCLLKASKEDAL
jgi:hypothetical protein